MGAVATTNIEEAILQEGVIYEYMQTPKSVIVSLPFISVCLRTVIA